jgi:hypothetical protein
MVAASFPFSVALLAAVADAYSVGVARPLIARPHLRSPPLVAHADDGGAAAAATPEVSFPPAIPDEMLQDLEVADAILSQSQYASVLRSDERELGDIMSEFGLQAHRPSELPQKGVYCTRALDMREIKAIGYDMDYTLIDYKMELVEERVYHYSKMTLDSKGFPVSGLIFDPRLVVRGLIVDTSLGHTLKVDRFGHVRRAMHGTRELSPEEIYQAYENPAVTVDLREDRWVFMNTLFSVSEGCLYAQLVDRLDSGELLRDAKEPFDASRCSTYEQLWRAVSKALFKAHVQGTMKAELMRDPLRFVNIDPA